MLRRRAAATAAVLCLCLAAGCGGTRTDPGARYLRGTGAVADDWKSVPYLSVSRRSRSDLVGLWQSLLWADGYLAKRQVDCRFDAATSLATRTWQSNLGLNSDGIAGPVSFGAAGRRLFVRDGRLAYHGAIRDLPLWRDRSGRYGVDDAGTHRPLREDSTTLAVCS